MSNTIEIARVLGKATVANDNDGRPAVIPVFVALLARHDLTRTDVLVYGAMVALHRAGAEPHVRDIAELAGITTAHYCRHCRSIIAKLIRAGLVERRYQGGQGVPSEYVLLGPDVAA